MMVIIKKEWVWIMRRHSHRTTHMMPANELRIQPEIDQEGRQKVDEFIT